MERPRIELARERASNYALVQADSVFLGLANVMGTFLPVFLVRLGASGSEVGLLTSIPGLTAVLLAIPAGRWLQRRRNIVPWYSGLRLVAWLSYIAIALAVVLAPPALAVAVILSVWAAASLPMTAAQVAFPIIMDGAAGPNGRFDLLGRRWAIAGATTTVGVMAAGQALGLAAFPVNFELLLAACALAGVGSSVVSRRIVIADQPPTAAGTSPASRAGVLEFVRIIRSRATFLDFELRSFLVTAAIGLTLPLLPLLYVTELKAPDVWIGVIGAAQSVGAVVGFIVARRVSQRRGAPAVLLPSMLVAALSPAAMALAGDLPVVAAVALVSGIAGAGASLGLFNELMKRVPREHGVTFSSVDQTLQNLALVIGPSAGGLLAALIGVRQGLAVAAVVGMLGFAMFALDWHKGRGAAADGGKAR